MKTYKFLILTLGTLLFASCEKELDRDLTDVSVTVATNENVRYEGNILTVKKGTPVEFLFHGDPDYISFFSGEIGHQYIYRDRKEISVEDIVSCDFKFSIWAQYGVANSCKDQFDVLYLAEEEDPDNQGNTIFFPGMSKNNFEADSVLVEKNTPWKELITRAQLPQAPVTSAAGALSFSKSVKEYIGKKLTLALVLNRDQKEAISANNPEDPEATIVQSTFNILNMCVETKWKNGRVTTTYASSFGFTPLNMKNKTKYEEQAPENMPKDLEYGSVSTGVTGMWNLSSIKSGGFTINGTAANNPWKYNWLVSDYLNLAECQANVGGANLANALANLKEVRDRAGVPTTTTVPEQSKLIEMIHNERFIEFWNEGHRYHDVRRWAEGQKYFGAKREGLNAMVKDVPFEKFNVRTTIDQPFRWNDRLYLAPIQNAEVYKNPQMVQAYGY